MHSVHFVVSCSYAAYDVEMLDDKVSMFVVVSCVLEQMRIYVYMYAC